MDNCPFDKNIDTFYPETVSVAAFEYCSELFQTCESYSLPKLVLNFPIYLVYENINFVSKERGGDCFRYCNGGGVL